MQSLLSIRAGQSGGLSLGWLQKSWGARRCTNFFKGDSGDLEWIKGRRQERYPLAFLVFSLVLGGS